jgi:multiple sugar transport system substrate-binding protein
VSQATGPGTRSDVVVSRFDSLCALALVAAMAAGCGNSENTAAPVLHWYVFNEPSGAFAEAAHSCSATSGGAFSIDISPLPADADQQREQLVRRLAAEDRSIDLIGMDVIWTAEFAEAGWILPWTGERAARVTAGRLTGPVQSATYRDRLWAAPFTSNAQLLWYRTDRIETPPATWDEMIDMAEALGAVGTIEAQGERYEGLTVLFTSLLASAGGSVLDPTGRRVSLERGPTLRALRIMRRFANSPAADPALTTAREDQARLAFETGRATFMLNYPFVWPSAHRNAPEVAAHMGWARWPAVTAGRPSRVTLGGINLGVGAFSRYRQLAFRAASCLASSRNQLIAAERGGLPPTIAELYDRPGVREEFPFADTLRATIDAAVQRPQTPLYNDVSLAITHVLHPMRDIQPDRDLLRLRQAVDDALHSRGLL